MYSIDDLNTFVSVAQTGGITSGARTLGLSPATVSHRISKLEFAPKIALFHRNSRNFNLTDEGQIFLERIEAVLADLQHAEQEAGSGVSQLRGHLRVTMSPWILSRFLMPKLDAFRSQHPDLSIEFLAVDRFVPLVEEGQDCAIRVGQLPDSALIAQKLCDNERIICAAPSFLKANGTPKTPNNLREKKWVCLPWQTRIHLNKPAGRPLTLGAPRDILVSNSDTLTEGVRQGLGLAIKSRLAVKAELESGELVEVLPGALKDPAAPISFVSSAEARQGRKTKLFGAFVRHVFESV